MEKREQESKITEAYQQSVNRELCSTERQLLQLIRQSGESGMAKVHITQELHLTAAETRWLLQKLQQAQLISQWEQESCNCLYRLTAQGKKISLLHRIRIGE